MKKTFVDVMLELPVDTTLRDFLTSHGLPVPDGFAWDDTPETSQILVEAVKIWPDTDARDRMTANLLASVQLGDAAGKQAMFEAVVADGAALVGLTLCQSDIHRSFWLYVHHPALFDRAYDFSFWENHGPQTQQYDLGLKRQPNTADSALVALRQAISAFYKRELQCGDGSEAHLIERSPGVFLLSVHIKDMAMLRLEFEGSTLKRRVGNPNIHMVLEYAKATGVVRTLVRGGAKYQQMLVEAFAEHVLGVKANAHRIKSPTLDLSMLRTGFDVQEAFEDGFSMVQLKALTLLSPDSALKIDCTAMQSSQQRSVHELLKEKLPGPLEGQWTVTAAQVNLYYPPEPGRTRPKVVTIEVTSKGRLNLHKFDAKMQAQLEGYLVAVGILQKGQTLSVQEPPSETDAMNSSPVLED
ncbi:hypothetical protein SKTS_30940 [Sulfurimicrobium lacus]|uniref:Uncharacterized protein n=1 Tax=Sulfurimicrobium lacus TaxID=2715678 RepID=A0A6F8VER6_9PROT|nr:hypothetical protein [Sulfurimicrobium lacus]BCB28208.1 hypothetical protein SKTS_30940 [Sulfurimicrobium lacus]